MQWRVTKKEAGMRLLAFLREKCPEAPSVKALKRAIDSKRCLVNQQIETFSSSTLEENDIVSLSIDAFETKKSAKISIIHEDDDLLVINKPAGIVSDSRSLHLKATLVHRLDKETSGVLVLAKNSHAKEKLVEAFKKRGVTKLYLAIVDGVIAKDEGKIENYLGKKQSYQGQTIYGSVPEKKGLQAITFWKCLQRGKTASFVSCEPITGRTHQLRVHLSEIGHPILGDAQYGKRFRCPFKPCRNLLHAYQIAFNHPTTGRPLKIIAPIPADFKHALTELQLKGI
jgi:23S rRNA pseudouridine955/2504/2580 synthase/23S rRNA pseudouridine1911/1915/1917 synthase